MADPNGAGAVPDAAKGTGIFRQQVSQIDSLKDFDGTTAIYTRGTSGGAKITTPKTAAGSGAGRPNPKAAPPPLPRRTAAEMALDKEEFAALIKELLSCTTDSWADERAKILGKGMSPEMAKEISDKLRLTPIEKKWVGRLFSKLWDKWIGADFEYSDEAMFAAMSISYYLRNREGTILTKTLMEKINGAAQQSGLQAAPVADSGHDGNGQDVVRNTADRA